jgi:hypothetical protein
VTCSLAPFSADLLYLGAYRAWREAVLSDAELVPKEERIQAWTSGRIATVFQSLQRLPGARASADLTSLARVMNSFFWNLLGQAAYLRRSELNRWIDSATHLIYHALFSDSGRETDLR